jgi:hypothetical protein
VSDAEVRIRGESEQLVSSEVEEVRCQMRADGDRRVSEAEARTRREVEERLRSEGRHVSSVAAAEVEARVSTAVRDVEERLGQEGAVRLRELEERLRQEAAAECEAAAQRARQEAEASLSRRISTAVHEAEERGRSLVGAALESEVARRVEAVVREEVEKAERRVRAECESELSVAVACADFRDARDDMLKALRLEAEQNNDAARKLVALQDWVRDDMEAAKQQLLAELRVDLEAEIRSGACRLRVRVVWSVSSCVSLRRGECACVVDSPRACRACAVVVVGGGALDPRRWRDVCRRGWRQRRRQRHHACDPSVDGLVAAVHRDSRQQRAGCRCQRRPR